MIVSFINCKFCHVLIPTLVGRDKEENLTREEWDRERLWDRGRPARTERAARTINRKAYVGIRASRPPDAETRRAGLAREKQTSRR